METHHRFVLLKQIDDIAKEIHAREIARSLAHHQQSEKRVLPIILLKDVARQPSPGKQAYRLIELLVSCGPRAFDALCEALETHGHEKLLQALRRAEKDTRVADPAVLKQLQKVTSKLPTPESYVDVCRNSAEAFTSDVWVEHLLPLLKSPIDPTDSIRQRVLDGNTRQDKAEALLDWLIRKVNAHGHQAFFALLEALTLTYPHVAEEFWNHLKTIAVTKVDSKMATKAAGGKWQATGIKVRTKGKGGDSLTNGKLSNGDPFKLPSDVEIDYHTQLDRAVEVIGEANAKIRRTEDRIKVLENEKTDFEKKLQIALRESYSLRSELEALKQEKETKNLKEIEQRRSRERKLKTLQEEVETKESLMADREIELRRRELELDQRVTKVRRQQADVERQLLDVLEKDKSFEGRVHSQTKKDEELKRRDRALTVRESVIADKEDMLTRNLEELKNKETNLAKATKELEKKRGNLNELKRKNDEVAMKLAEKKMDIEVKEKEVGITLVTVRKDEAELMKKVEQLENMEEQIEQRQVEIQEKERGLSQKSREAGEFEKEKQQFISERKRWHAEAAKIRNELERERKTLRERDMDLKAKERELKIKEKEWRVVKDELDRHLQDQEKIERSIQAIEMEQHRIEMAQSLREAEMEHKEERDRLISSMTYKEDELRQKVNDIHKKEQAIRSREQRLKEEEERVFQLRYRGDNQLRDSGDYEMVLEDVSETQTPSLRRQYKPLANTPLNDGSTPESGFSDGHPGEYRILQRGIISATHRNQAFSVKPGNVKTVGEMKQVIYRREGIPISWQLFYFNSKLLPDTSILPPPESLASGFLDLRLDVPVGNMPLIIRMNSAISRKIEFDNSETIAAAKTRIYKSEGIPPHQQNLFYGDMELKNKFHLSDYHILPGSELFLRLRYDIAVVLDDNHLLGFTVEDLDTVASVKGRISKAKNIPVEYQVLTYEGKTMANQRPLGYYCITEGSRIFVSFAVTFVMEPTRETFTMPLDDPQIDCSKVKEKICRFRGIHIHLQKLVMNGRLLDDNAPIIEQLSQGGSVHIHHGNILVTDENGKVLMYDVQPWHNVAAIKEILCRKTGIPTRHQHLMFEDQELKTVNRPVKHYGVKRSNILVLKTENSAL